MIIHLPSLEWLSYLFTDDQHASWLLHPLSALSHTATATSRAVPNSSGGGVYALCLALCWRSTSTGSTAGFLRQLSATPVRDLCASTT